jgi:acyl-coenzyme A thioesterase 9
MVARDINNRAFTIPQVIPETLEEKEWSLDAQANRDRRKRRAQKSLDIEAPTPDERLIIHKLFMDRKRNLSKGTTQYTNMQSTFHQSVTIMHPQNRNIHNKVHIFSEVIRVLATAQQLKFPCLSVFGRFLEAI